jgi:hypothetical protein
VSLFFRDCLTSASWSGARNKIHHAIKQHTIDKIIVLGSAGIFSHTSDHLFWQHELTFILAIFELGKFDSTTSLQALNTYEST